MASRSNADQPDQRKPVGKPMLRATARANARKSTVRVAVEHLFARQKVRNEKITFKTPFREREPHLRTNLNQLYGSGA